METLSHNDILALNSAIGELYAIRNIESFHKRVFFCLRGIVSCDMASYNEYVTPLRIVKVINDSPEHIRLFHKLKPAFDEHIHEHPFVHHLTEEHPWKTSDSLTGDSFRGLSIYNEYYKHLDIENQAIINLPMSQGNGALYALSRKRPDFSERDRLILTLLRPHLINALRNIIEMERLKGELNLMQKGAEIDREGVILLQSDGKVLRITQLAKELIERYFKKVVCGGDSIPADLLNWFKGEISSTPKKVEREPLFIETDGSCLKIRGLIDFMTGDYMLVMNETDPSQCINLKGYGLSDREIDVLKWLSQGKSNVDIAEILGINRRTVEKHVEHIFAKLGVETRAAAAAMVMQR